MRVARYFPMVVVTGLMFPTTTPFTASASESAAIEVSDQSPDPQMRGRYTDPSLQQAGYYDSRPRQNSTTIMQPGAAPQKRALFSGDAISMPKSWFGRSAQPQQSQPKNYAAQTMPNRPVVSQANQMPPNAANQMRPRVANQMPQPSNISRPTQQPVINGRAMQPLAANTNFRNTPAQQPIPIQQNAMPRPMSLASRPTPTAQVAPPSQPQAAPNSTSVSPWKDANPNRNTASATHAATTKPTGQPTQGDQLIAQAHTLSTSAKTEQDYSRIIETCRRAEAGQVSPESLKYAHTLTGWSFNRRGQLKAEAGHDKEAILDFDDAVRADAMCWRAVHNRGVLLAQAGQFEKAFDDFARTIQLNPSFAKAYSNRAALFMVANNLNAAHQDYKKAIEFDANLAVAHRGCGRVCQLLNQLDDAVLHYDAAVQLAPNDAYAAACRADLLTDIGRYSDALTEYNRALTIDPNSSQANCGSAWLLATCPDSALRNPTLAVERANQAIQLSSQKDAVSYDSLAAAQAAAGNFGGAMEAINKAIELAPADERDAYKDRLAMYQQAKPYRIVPVERVAQQGNVAQQASYETN